MKYLYGVAYSALIGCGVFLIILGLNIMGFIAVGLGSILVVVNAFMRGKRNIKVFLLSLALIAIFLIFGGVGATPIEQTLPEEGKVIPDPTPAQEDIVLPPATAITTVTPPTEPPLIRTIAVPYNILYNHFREEYNLEPLVFTDDLNRVAALRLKEIKRDFSHDSLGNYNEHLGENIAMQTGGLLSDFQALNLWENSPGHRANMLEADYRYTGYANDGGYAVQVFSEFRTNNGVPQLPEGWFWVE